MTTPASSAPARRFGWQTPLIIVIGGCMIGMLGFGARTGLGFFLTPMSTEFGWGRDVFALALAIQMLLWGAAQPIAGAIADRFGPVPVLCVGAIVYSAGLAAMAYSTTPASLHLTAGVLIGFGLATSSFTLVLGAFGKLLEPRWRSLAFGAGTASGSFGQFLFSPLAVAWLGAYGWQHTLLILAALVLLIIPFSLALATPRTGGADAPGAAPQQTVSQALAEALGHRSYVLLVLGFFTCGFQLFFISVHLPAYLIDRGLGAEIGGWTLGTIGLFNIFGALMAGWLAGGLMPKRYLLSFIYFGRALAILVYIMLPPHPTTTLVFGAVLGLLWLSTVPPTSGLVALMFGTRWLATLFGFAFFSHQVGGFLGVWLGGILFERTGSYDIVWWLSILFGVLSAVINLPIVEKPVPRLAPQPA